MAKNDWYPNRESRLGVWHATFRAECTNYAAHFPAILTAGVLAKVADNADLVALLAVGTLQAKNYSKEFMGYKQQWLRGSAIGAIPAVPVPPPMLTIPAAAGVGIEEFTRSVTAQIKADPAYTRAVGEALGIERPSSSLGDPSIRRVIALGESTVRLTVRKAGYPVLAVESRRGDGGWEAIGISMTAFYIDRRAPLAEGLPEVREYRVQGILKNIQQGQRSAIRSVVTMP